VATALPPPEVNPGTWRFPIDRRLLLVATIVLVVGILYWAQALLTLSVANASMGLVFGLGLLLIGVPYALHWGTLLALARFVPYVGVWPAAGLPTALALSVFNGWGPALMVVALFLGLEVLANVLVEPVLYSQHAGVSKVALLVAIGFWTWLWGPVGLILATPLTVGLVVLAKYVPSLHPVGVLLGDEPALDPAAVYYQRLVAPRCR